VCFLKLLEKNPSHSHFLSIYKPTVVLKYFFGNSLSDLCLTHYDTCNHLWLLNNLMSEFRILSSQKRQLLSLYRVSPLWRQGSKRDNETYISSQVKSALRKLREGKVHDCDLFMSDVSDCTSLVLHIWLNGPPFLLNLNALTRFLRLQATEWENDEPCEHCSILENYTLSKC